MRLCQEEESSLMSEAGSIPQCALVCLTHGCQSGTEGDTKNMQAAPPLVNSSHHQQVCPAFDIIREVEAEPTLLLFTPPF